MNLENLKTNVENDLKRVGLQSFVVEPILLNGGLGTVGDIHVEIIRTMKMERGAGMEIDIDQQVLGLMEDVKHSPLVNELNKEIENLRKENEHLQLFKTHYDIEMNLRHGKHHDR